MPKWLISALVVVVVVSSVVLYLLFKRDPHAPPAIVVSACGDVAAGVRRMTAGYGTQIDAPEDAFVVKSTLQDMPPGRIHSVTLRNSTAKITILPDDGSWKELKDALPVFLGLSMRGAHTLEKSPRSARTAGVIGKEESVGDTSRSPAEMLSGISRRL